MEKKVICSECGHIFNIDDTNAPVYEPSNCSECGRKVINVVASPTSNDFTAMVLDLGEGGGSTTAIKTSDV